MVQWMNGLAIVLVWALPILLTLAVIKAARRRAPGE